MILTLQCLTTDYKTLPIRTNKQIFCNRWGWKLLVISLYKNWLFILLLVSPFRVKREVVSLLTLQKILLDVASRVLNTVLFSYLWRFAFFEALGFAFCSERGCVWIFRHFIKYLKSWWMIKKTCIQWAFSGYRHLFVCTVLKLMVYF